MNPFSPFKWRHYQSEVILVWVRWGLNYPLSRATSSTAFSGRIFLPERCLEMVNERGLDVHHTTVFGWVQEYSPEIDKRCRPHLKLTNHSWRVDETYILVKGKQKYLY